MGVDLGYNGGELFSAQILCQLLWACSVIIFLFMILVFTFCRCGMKWALSCILRKKEIIILKKSLVGLLYKFICLPSISTTGAVSLAKEVASWQNSFLLSYLQRCSSAFLLKAWMVSLGILMLGLIRKGFCFQTILNIPVLASLPPGPMYLILEYTLKEFTLFLLRELNCF